MKSFPAQTALVGLIALLQLTGCEDRGSAGRLFPEPVQSTLSTAQAAPNAPEVVEDDRESPTIATLSEPPVLDLKRVEPNKHSQKTSVARPKAPIQARSIINPSKSRSIEPVEPYPYPDPEPIQPSSEQAKPSLEAVGPKIEQPRLSPTRPPAPVLEPSAVASQQPAPSGPRVTLPIVTSLGVGAAGLVLGFTGTEMYAKDPSGSAVALSVLGATAAGVGFTMAGVLMFAGDDAPSQPVRDVRVAVGPGSMILSGTF